MHEDSLLLGQAGKLYQQTKLVRQKVSYLQKNENDGLLHTPVEATSPYDIKNFLGSDVM